MNMGYPVNTTGEDLFFNPGWDELDGFYAVRREDDPTSNTINMVIEMEPEELVVQAEDPIPMEEQTPIPMEEQTPIESEIPVVESMVDSEASPEPEETVQPELTMVEVQPVATITEAIEPEETDKIEEVLNRDAIKKPVELETVETVEPEVVEPVEIVRGPMELESGIPFDHNKFELNMPAMLEVEKIAEIMVFNPEASIALTGHADATGSAEYNMLLSLNRADQIAQYLEMRGVDPGRILINGKGENAPIARNSYPNGDDAPLGRYLNRQVCVHITCQAPMQADLTGLYIPTSLKYDKGKTEGANSKIYWFTVQVSASTAPMGMSRLQGIEQVKEYICTDGYYRYTTGAYNSFQEARDQLKKIHKLGIEDAFIQTVEWYEQVTE